MENKFVPALCSHPMRATEIHSRYKNRAKRHKLNFSEAEFTKWIRDNKVMFEDVLWWDRNDLEVYGIDNLVIQRYGQRYGGKK